MEYEYTKRPMPSHSGPTQHQASSAHHPDGLGQHRFSLATLQLNRPFDDNTEHGDGARSQAARRVRQQLQITPFSSTAQDAPRRLSKRKHPNTESAQNNFQMPTEKKTDLPDNIKTGIETVSGLSLDGVRVHYDSPQPAKMQARAYTQGANIFVGPGQEQHLAHEAWHQVQQRRGEVNATHAIGGQRLNADAALEKEADVMGERAINHTSMSQPTNTPTPTPLSTQTPAIIQRKVVDNTSGKDITTVAEINQYVADNDLTKNIAARTKKGGRALIAANIAKDLKTEETVTDAKSIEDFLLTYGYITKQSLSAKKKSKGKQGNVDTMVEEVNKINAPSKVVVGKRGGGQSTTITQIDQSTKRPREEGPTKRFETDRPGQSQRHAATVMFNNMNTEEIQTATKEGIAEPATKKRKLAIAANENPNNDFLRKNVKTQKDLQKFARDNISKNKEDFKNKPVALRTLRHSGKLLNDKHGVFSNLEDAIHVPPNVPPGEDGLHAELRLIRDDWEKPSGVKRPCIGCAIALEKHGISVEHTGPLWPSASALKPIYKKLGISEDTQPEQLTEAQIKQIAAEIAAPLAKSRLTKVEKGAATTDYGSDSETDIDISDDERSSDDENRKAAKQAKKRIAEWKAESWPKKKKKISPPVTK